jgi:hypothetical protein
VNLSDMLLQPYRFLVKINGKSQQRAGFYLQGFHSLCLNLRLVLLIGIQATNHITHSLRVEMRQGHGGQDNVTPIITWPVKISVIVSIAARIQAIAVAVVCLMLKRLRLLNVVVEFMFLGRASEVQFVLLDGRVRVNCPRDVVSNTARKSN